MPPGKENEEEFAHNIGVGNVKVVFCLRDGEPFVYILVEVLLSGIHGGFADLEGHLRGWVVDEVAHAELIETAAAHTVRRLYVALRGRRLLVGVAIAIYLRLLLLSCRWRW